MPKFPGFSMRAILFILVIAVLLVIVAVATGFLNIRQIRGEAPQITASRNGITAKGGQAPAFDVETGSVKVGTKANTVKTATLEVQKAGQNQATNNAQ